MACFDSSNEKSPSLEVTTDVSPIFICALAIGLLLSVTTLPDNIIKLSALVTSGKSKQTVNAIRKIIFLSLFFWL